MNQYDYGFRIYDPRIGRFFSEDSLTKSYPKFSPYHFSGNNPVMLIDLDGAEFVEPFAARMGTDAAITVTSKPNSNKAKVYGVIVGISGSIEGNVPVSTRRPFQSLLRFVR